MIYGFPDLGNGIKTANTKRGIFSEPGCLGRTVKLGEIEEKRELAQQRFNINPQHTLSSVCMYTITPDEHFIIDFPNSDPDVIASPCSGHGFKFASRYRKDPSGNGYRPLGTS